MVSLLDLIFPGSCAVCGREPARLCKAHSIESQRLLPEGRCRRCYFQLHGGKCRKCAGQEIFFDSHRALYGYASTVRTLISRWKFENDRPVGELWIEPLARLLADLAPDRAGVIDSQRRLRSFRPAADLLLSARCAKVPYGVDLRKKRIARTRKQSQRNQAGRYFEVRDSLELVRDLSRVKHYVLVDDVFTTGATANEAARILKICGVERVSILTVAMREELELDSNGADLTAVGRRRPGFDSPGKTGAG